MDIRCRVCERDMKKYGTAVDCVHTLKDEMNELKGAALEWWNGIDDDQKNEYVVWNFNSLDPKDQLDIIADIFIEKNGGEE